MPKVYYRFELKNSSSALKKVNSTKVRYLEQELKKIGFDLFGGRDGANGGVVSLLVGAILTEEDGKIDLDTPIKEVREIMSDLDFPYSLKDFYTQR